MRHPHPHPQSKPQHWQQFLPSSPHAYASSSEFATLSGDFTADDPPWPPSTIPHERNAYIATTRSKTPTRRSQIDQMRLQVAPSPLTPRNPDNLSPSTRHTTPRSLRYPYPPSDLFLIRLRGVPARPQGEDDVGSSPRSMWTFSRRRNCVYSSPRPRASSIPLLSNPLRSLETVMVMSASFRCGLGLCRESGRGFVGDRWAGLLRRSTVLCCVNWKQVRCSLPHFNK
ncbi:hypothetical protein OF83DRAFT_643271 [Amylostereum chailletii]|nr:hypothetical protein OF83DRAFT_643271 [Amylostereum chailletii]